MRRSFVHWVLHRCLHQYAAYKVTPRVLGLLGVEHQGGVKKHVTHISFVNRMSGVQYKPLTLAHDEEGQFSCRVVNKVREHLNVPGLTFFNRRDEPCRTLPDNKTSLLQQFGREISLVPSICTWETTLDAKNNKGGDPLQHAMHLWMSSDQQFVAIWRKSCFWIYDIQEGLLRKLFCVRPATLRTAGFTPENNFVFVQGSQAHVWTNKTGFVGKPALKFTQRQYVYDAAVAGGCIFSLEQHVRGSTLLKVRQISKSGLDLKELWSRRPKLGSKVIVVASECGKYCCVRSSDCHAFKVYDVTTRTGIYSGDGLSEFSKVSFTGHILQAGSCLIWCRDAIRKYHYGHYAVCAQGLENIAISGTHYYVTATGLEARDVQSFAPVGKVHIPGLSAVTIVSHVWALQHEEVDERENFPALVKARKSGIDFFHFVRFKIIRRNGLD